MVERIPEPIPAEEESKSVIDILFDHYFATRKEDTPEIDVAYRLFCHFRCCGYHYYEGNFNYFE